MTNTVVVCSHLPGEHSFRSEKFRVVRVPCMKDEDYCEGLQALWDTNLTIVNVEHDVETTDSLIQGLLDCPYPLCGYPYLLRARDSHYSYRNGPLPPAGGQPQHWLKDGEEWATYGGIGFCKITPEARVRTLGNRHWSVVDISVSKAVEGPEVVHPGAHQGRRWHVHWPAIGHHHDGP